jgi:hypothetical protein
MNAELVSETWCIWTTWRGCKPEEILLNSVRFALSACPEDTENNVACLDKSRNPSSRVNIAGTVSSPPTYSYNLLSLASLS